MATAVEQLAQLNQVRNHVLADAVHYPDIISGIVPLIGTGNHLETQRWGAEFMAEAFASPMVSGPTKEKMALTALPVIRDWLADQPDEAVIKSATQTAASVYPYVFRHVTNNKTATSTWELMTSIKTSILRRFDSAPVGIRIVCIKFVQRVVQVQTPGIIADPRRPDQNEISAALVPRDHPIVPLPKLEAEASGLLDRLLRVFQDPSSDVIIVDATLNCLSVLVRTRQSISNKIVSAVLSFNPFKTLQPPLSGKQRVRLRSVERTVRAFLWNIGRRHEHAQFKARITQTIERNQQTRLELEGQNVGKKRGPPEPTDGLDDAKRQRLGAPAESRPAFAPMPAPPLSLAQVFTLTNDATGRFDASVLPHHLIQQIVMVLLRTIDKERLDEAVTAIRARLLELDRIASTAAATLPVPVPVPDPDGGGDDDDYEPEFEPAEDYEQVMNDLDAAPSQDIKNPDGVPEVALGPFKLPQPAPISQDEAQLFAKGSVGRVFSMIEQVDSPAKPIKAGLNRLAGSHFDNDAWVTLITRLATRTPSNLDATNGDEAGTSGDAQLGSLLKSSAVADSIRETLFKWVMADFRHRINVAISWLNEEWYNEQVLAKADASYRSSEAYDTWTLRLLDAISPYLDAKDKSIMRFISEIPALSNGVFQRIKSIANDPDRAGLAVNILHYLIVIRPPVREQALDALEDLYSNYQGAAMSAKKVLAKWRPHVVGGSAPAAPTVKEETGREASSTPVIRSNTTPATSKQDAGESAQGSTPLIAA